jgi:hypothetical protein
MSKPHDCHCDKQSSNVVPVLLNKQQTLTQTQIPKNIKYNLGSKILSIIGLSEPELLEFKMYSSSLTTSNYNASLVLRNIQVSTNQNAGYISVPGLTQFVQQSITNTDTKNTTETNNNSIQPFIKPLYADGTQNINQLVDTLTNLSVYNTGTQGSQKYYTLTFGVVDHASNQGVGLGNGYPIFIGGNCAPGPSGSVGTNCTFGGQCNCVFGGNV